MRTTLLLVFSAAVIFSSLRCDSKKEPIQEDFSCIKIFDENGTGLGLHGDCTSSNDWGNVTLSASEQAFLDFTDTVSLSGTLATAIQYFSSYTCPVTIDEPIHITFARDEPDHPVKLKIAIVDESLQVVQQLAIRIENTGLALHIDPAKFQSGKYYRMYYRVSATGAPSLFEGYGNFLVCKTHINGVTTTIESDCM